MAKYLTILLNIAGSVSDITIEGVVCNMSSLLSSQIASFMTSYIII